jgi:hypothetical protein
LPFVAYPPRRGNGNGIAKNLPGRQNPPPMTPVLPGTPRQRENLAEARTSPRDARYATTSKIIYRTREHEVDVFVIAIDYSSERLSAQCLLYGRWHGSSILTAVHAAARPRQRDEAKPGCLRRMSVRCSLRATCQTRQSVVQHAHRNVRAENVRPVRPARSIPRRAARPVRRFGTAVTLYIPSLRCNPARTRNSGEPLCYLFAWFPLMFAISGRCMPLSKRSA